MFENHDLYKLRWRFDYANRPSKCGQWSKPATRDEDMAARQLKDGLIRASIEGQDISTQEIFTLAECDGHDFCNFQWISAQYGMSPGHAKIVGLAIMTRNQVAQVFVDGSSKILERPENDKNYHYAIYGR